VAGFEFVRGPVRYLNAFARHANNLNMTIVEITGGMLRAARSLIGGSQQQFADRASISGPCRRSAAGFFRSGSA